MLQSFPKPGRWSWGLYYTSSWSQNLVVGVSLILAGGRALQSGHQAKSTVITTCAKIEKKKEKSSENLVKMQLHQILLLSIASQTTVAQRLVEAGSLVTFI